MHFNPLHHTTRGWWVLRLGLEPVTCAVAAKRLANIGIIKRYLTHRTKDYQRFIFWSSGPLRDNLALHYRIVLRFQTMTLIPG